MSNECLPEQHGRKKKLSPPTVNLQKQRIQI